jgi:hypothetical protein
VGGRDCPFFDVRRHPGCGVLSRESRAQAGVLVVTHPKNEQSATKQFNVSQKFAAA